MVLSLLAVTALAAECAPSVAPSTLAAVVAVESGFDPLAIGVNSRRHFQLHPVSKTEAIASASRLIAHGANVDLGLGQINARNLGPLGLSLDAAFDPCRNLTATGLVMSADYMRALPHPGAEQSALRTSLSFYNTGTAWRGFANGYVAKVIAAASRIVPALQSDTPASSPVHPSASPPPAWDVFVQATAPAAGFVYTPVSEDSH